jgi:hypothetical protein
MNCIVEDANFLMQTTNIGTLTAASAAAVHINGLWIVIWICQHTFYIQPQFLSIKSQLQLALLLHREEHSPSVDFWTRVQVKIAMASCF